MDLFLKLKSLAFHNSCESFVHVLMPGKEVGHRMLRKNLRRLWEANNQFDILYSPAHSLLGNQLSGNTQAYARTHGFNTVRHT